MRSAADEPAGYPAEALDTWAGHAHAWARGEDPAALPHAGALQPDGAPREVFIFFISSAKERNPAAAMALQARVDRPRP
jgi:uncharacterized protein YecE (DUF72 family)